MRWGIAGFGWVAADYMAPGIRAAGGTVTAIADPSPRARERAESLGMRAFETAEAMLAAGVCDLLYVATGTRLVIGARDLDRARAVV